MSKKKVETPVVVVMDFSSCESMKEKLKLASPELQDVFAKCETKVAADSAFDLSTVAFVKSLTDSGIPFEELIETYESNVKAMGLWPTYIDDKTKEEKHVAINIAAKTSLAAKIRRRIAAMLNKERNPVILNEDGMLQFYEVSGEPVIVTDNNTDMDGNFTQGSKQGGKMSVSENTARAEKASTNARTPDTVKDDGKGEESKEQSEAQSNEEARHARQTLDLIGKSFGTSYEHIVTVQKIHESFRAKLAQTDTGKEYLEAMAGHFDQMLQNQEDIADVLGIVSKDGKYIVKRAV